MLTASEALSLLAVVTSVAAAVFLSRASSRPGRAELHDLGQGNILGGGASTLLFGIRAAAVQSALTQWVSHMVGVGLLCLGIAEQVSAMTFGKTEWSIPALPCIILEVAAGLAIWLAGSELVRVLSARAIMRAVREEIQFWRVRSPRAVAQLTEARERGELIVHVGRLLRGLVSAERALRLAQSLLSDLEQSADSVKE